MQAFPSAVTQRHSILMRVLIVVLPVLILLAVAAPSALTKTTYVITDGEDVTVCTSYSTNVEKVLDKAGIRLDANDVYHSLPGDGVSEITIQRGQSITLYNCGKKMDVVGYNETVQALLSRLGVPTSGDFVVSVDLNTAATEGMQIRVDHILQNTAAFLCLPEDQHMEGVFRIALGKDQILVHSVAVQVRHLHRLLVFTGLGCGIA
jgi:uncharacterized protein YabE (DUF348 family)